MHHDGSERKILVGFSLIGLLWLIDVLMETFVFGGSILNSPLDSERNEAVLHAFIFTVQLGLIVYTWRVFDNREHIGEALNEAVGEAFREKSRFEAVVAAMGDGISVQDRDFRILYQNKVHQELVGGDRQGGVCYREYAHRDTVCDGCPVALCFDDGKVHRQEKAAAQGAVASHIEITASPLRDISGNIVAGIELVRDISEKKKTEEGLSLQTTFLQKLMDTIPLPVFYKNTAGCYLGCNREFEIRLGISTEELVGKTMLDIVPPDLVRTYFAHDLALLEQGGTQTFEEPVRFADGEFHDVVFHKALYYGINGSPDGIVGVMVDVSEEKRWKEQIEELNADLSRKAVELEAVNRDLESFSYSASHDLRNPLSQVSASAQLLEAEFGDMADERHGFLVKTILDSCDKMESLIDDLLTLAQTARTELELGPVDLSSLAASVAMNIRLAEPDRQVLVTIEPDMQAVCCPSLVRIVLENLLNNAWKYTRFSSQPVISFGRTLDGAETVYFVRDNGAGFDMGSVDRLFRPFQRLHDATFPGTGIGLATVQRIVNRHGGRVWAEGAVGAGATFYFTLPAA